jgi:hypothetical protein
METIIKMFSTRLFFFFTVITIISLAVSSHWTAVYNLYLFYIRSFLSETLFETRSVLEPWPHSPLAEGRRIRDSLLTCWSMVLYDGV